MTVLLIASSFKTYDQPMLVYKEFQITKFSYIQQYYVKIYTNEKFLFNKTLNLPQPINCAFSAGFTQATTVLKSNNIIQIKKKAFKYNLKKDANNTIVN